MSAVTIRGLTIVLAVALAAGCAAAPDQPGGSDVLSAPRPVGVQDPAPPVTAPPPADAGCDPRASLRPRGPLPPPGRMPADTKLYLYLDPGWKPAPPIATTTGQFTFADLLKYAGAA